MKKILLPILLFLTLGAIGQTVTGTKTRTPGIWLSSKDTAVNATAADSIAILANRADSSLRFRYSTTAPWKKIQFAPLSGSFLINSYNLSDVTNTTTARTNIGALGVSDTAAMLVPYLRKTDTTGKWIANQYGQTLGPQPAKIWVSDTIKTNESVIVGKNILIGETTPTRSDAPIS